MKRTLKMMSFFAIAFCALGIGSGVAKAGKIDVINGQDASGINYGTITTTKNSCTITEADATGLITIASGKEVFVEVAEGCTQTFKVEVAQGYEIESVLMDRRYVEISADGTYTFDNMTGDHSICVKYKKVGEATSPATGEVTYILPLAATALISLALIIVIVRKRRSLKA